MRPTQEQMKAMSITPGSFDRIARYGLIDYNGRSMEWWQHQRPEHDRQFEEVRERKQGKKKFVKDSPKETR